MKTSKEFFEKLQNDEAFAQEIGTKVKAKFDAGEKDFKEIMIAIASEYGYEVTGEELDEMIRDEELKRPTGEEAEAALTEAGIPLGCTDEDLKTLLAASILCIDNGLFSIGRAYLGTLYEIVRGDTLINVHRSLNLKD